VKIDGLRTGNGEVENCVVMGTWSTRYEKERRELDREGGEVVCSKMTG